METAVSAATRRPAGPSVTGSRTAKLVDRVRGEYLEMPGLCLTEPQARRLFGLDRTTCLAIMEALVEARFLRRRPRDGAFVRARPR